MQVFIDVMTLWCCHFTTKNHLEDIFCPFSHLYWTIFNANLLTHWKHFINSQHTQMSITVFKLPLLISKIHSVWNSSIEQFNKNDTHSIIFPIIYYCMTHQHFSRGTIIDWHAFFRLSRNMRHGSFMLYPSRFM